MHIFFAHEAIGSNGENCPLGNFNIIIYFGNNLHLIGSHVQLSHGTHLHALGRPLRQEAHLPQLV